MLFTSALWDWGLTWGAVFFAPFVEFLDFMLSAMMDKAPLSIGSGVGPSNRPLLDLNLPPAPEPEPALPSELSEEEDLSLLERESKRARLDWMLLPRHPIKLLPRPSLSPRLSSLR